MAVIPAEATTYAQQHIIFISAYNNAITNIKINAISLIDAQKSLLAQSAKWPLLPSAEINNLIMNLKTSTLLPPPQAQFQSLGVVGGGVVGGGAVGGAMGHTI